MADILSFSRNRCITVEQVQKDRFKASCRLQDAFIDASVEIIVTVPDLEIMDVDGHVKRSIGGEGIDVRSAFKKIHGARVGPGIKKIIRGLGLGVKGMKPLMNMVEECCNGVILSFTKEVLLHAPKEKEKERAFFFNMVKANPRLYNSCAALAPGSPLMEGMEEDG